MIVVALEGRISWSSIIASVAGRRRNGVGLGSRDADSKHASETGASAAEADCAPQSSGDVRAGTNIRRVVVTICVLFWVLAIYLFLRSRGI
ncbi:MAG TPA: hypothetical protein VGO70_09165 [Arsenicitalea sp.]|nr:hypothetical protein [Arsenicitalea sp.]